MPVFSTIVLKENQPRSPLVITVFIANIGRNSCVLSKNPVQAYMYYIYILSSRMIRLLLLEGNSRISSHVSVSFATLSSVCQGVLDGLFKFS